MSKKKVKSDRMVAETVSERLFAISKDIRSVAVYYRGKLATVSRPDSGGASVWDSDKYEELIVNPTLMTLLRQRGNIDCGGVQYVVIRYGDFTQLVHPIPGGHISVGFAGKREYARIIPGIRKLLSGQNLTGQHGTRTHKITKE